MAEPTTHPTTQEATPLRFFLGEDQFDSHVAVSLASFLLFDNEITHGLDSLERSLADWSTPNSLRRDIWENIDR